MLKGNKGVTLVALVITIIVLLILAAVSISLVVGDNGVLSNATKSVDETNRAYAQSELEMALSSVQTDFFVDYLDNTKLVYTDYCTPSRVKTYLDEDEYTLGTEDGMGGSKATDWTDISYTDEDAENEICDDDPGKVVFIRYKGTTYAFNVTTNNEHDTGAKCTYLGFWDEEDLCWYDDDGNSYTKAYSGALSNT